MSSDSSDSENEFFEPQQYSSKSLSKMISNCKNFLPKDYKDSISNRKSRLAEMNNTDIQQKISNNSDTNRQQNRKQLEDTFKTLTEELANISKKFSVLSESVISILDDMEIVNERIFNLENTVEKLYKEKSKNKTYCETVKTPISVKSNDDRLSKLEYINSEEERKKNTLQSLFTHESINQNSDTLKDDIKNFFTDKLKMENREIDQNLNVKKSKRNNTVMVTFSDRRFKIFMYRALKKARSTEDNELETLFINDNLTSYNFPILMKLKREKKERTTDKKFCFQSCYSFDGKVYIKMLKTDSNEKAIHVRTTSMMQDIVKGLDNDHKTETAAGPSDITTPVNNTI